MKKGEYKKEGEKRYRQEKTFQVGEASLIALLGRCGYIADRKSGKQRGQRRILDILACHPDMSQKALQQQLEIKPGSMSEIMTKLEAKGLICREKDERDHRRMMIRLTEAGRREAQEHREEPQDEEIFQVLTREEKLQLRELLTKLLVQWRKERKEETKLYEE